MDSASSSFQSSSCGGGADDELTSAIPTSAVVDANNFNTHPLPNFASLISDPPFHPDATWLSTPTNQIPQPSPPPPPQPRLSTGVENVQLEQQSRPKKRPRASRRAPTTVLTTNTSNFRQMVQEFTGVPAQPFSSLARPCTTNYFGSGTSTTPEPKFLTRPLPQRTPIATSFESLLAGTLPVLTAPVGTPSQLPPSDSLLARLPSLPIVGSTVRSSTPTDERPTVGGSSSLFVASSRTGLDPVWPDGQRLPPPESSSGGMPTGDGGGGSVDTWFCSSDWELDRKQQRHR